MPVSVKVRTKTLVILIVIIVALSAVWWILPSGIYLYGNYGLDVTVTKGRVNGLMASPSSSWSSSGIFGGGQGSKEELAQEAKQHQQWIYSHLDLRGYRFRMSRDDVKAVANKRGDRIAPEAEMVKATDGTTLMFGYDDKQKLNMVAMSANYGPNLGFRQGSTVWSMKRVIGKPSFVMRNRTPLPIIDRPL
ncbi:MAG: hypothetical protein ACYC1M_10860 [Armatimonadota bacterium]